MCLFLTWSFHLTFGLFHFFFEVWLNIILVYIVATKSTSTYRGFSPRHFIVTSWINNFIMLYVFSMHVPLFASVTTGFESAAKKEVEVNLGNSHTCESGRGHIRFAVPADDIPKVNVVHEEAFPIHLRMNCVVPGPQTAIYRQRLCCFVWIHCRWVTKWGWTGIYLFLFITGNCVLGISGVYKGASTACELGKCHRMVATGTWKEDIRWKRIY